QMGPGGTEVSVDRMIGTVGHAVPEKLLHAPIVDIRDLMEQALLELPAQLPAQLVRLARPLERAGDVELHAIGSGQAGMTRAGPARRLAGIEMASDGSEECRQLSRGAGAGLLRFAFVAAALLVLMPLTLPHDEIPFL